MSKLIEVACTHNNGRSPLAHAFAEKYLQDRGIEGYQIISSGSDAARINDVLAGNIEMPIGERIFLARLGMKSGNPDYDPSWQARLEDPDSLLPDELAILQAIGHKSLNRIVKEEAGYRTVAFEKFNLGQPRNTQVQTIVRPDVNLWLGMGNSNVSQAQRIYDGAEHQPIFDTLAGYATRNPGEEFKSGFGGTLNDYLEMAHVIRGHTEAAMERAVAELD